MFQEIKLIDSSENNLQDFKLIKHDEILFETDGVMAARELNKNRDIDVSDVSCKICYIQDSSSFNKVINDFPTPDTSKHDK